MSKYIIEIKPEFEDSFKGVMILGARDSNLFVDVVELDNLEELNSDYINEHYGELQDTAYQKGLEDGKRVAVGAAELREKLEYQRGLDDAWEAARRIVCDEKLDWNTLSHLFNSCNFSGIFGDFSASEAIAKLKAYEEKQKADDKIVVGDEVTHKSDSVTWTAVVTQNDDGMLTLMGKTGAIADDYDEKCFVKTGRHFDIQKILEAMKK